MKLALPKVLKQKSTPTKTEQPNGFPVEYYGYSTFVRFCTNPILFKIRDLNGERYDGASNASGVLGSAFHHAMEVYYGGSDTLIVSNEQEAIQYGLAAGLDFLEKYQDGFITYSKTLSTKQKVMDAFTHVFLAYVKETPYRPNTVLAVEARLAEKIGVEWKGHRLALPVPLKGTLDRIDRVDGKIKIVDYKSCYAFSNPEKIDGQKIIQAVTYYLLAYAHYGEAPYSVIFEEVKYTKNSDGSPQVRRYEIVYAEHELFFDFYFRLYEDVTRALNGEMVYVPNVQALFDNEIALIAYIHRLDVPEERAALMKKHKVDNITDLLRREIQTADNMRKLLKAVEQQMVEAKSINYANMKNEDKIRTKMMEHGMVLAFDSLIEGATVDLYRFAPSIGIKMSRLRNYADDIEQVVGISGVRVLAPIPETNLVGFEVPRKSRRYPSLPAHNGTHAVAIGETVIGTTLRFDLRDAPHMLVAGTTGSGKSVFLNNIIQQLLATPGADLHLFDPKSVELAHYADQAKEYADDAKDIAKSLSELTVLMDKRYKQMKAEGMKSIRENARMRYHYVIIDEYADLAMRADVDQQVKRLAQKGRAAGIHIILATQRASTRVIDGDIKVNFPVKAVFKMGKAIDSMVMLDEAGAEKLAGKGDMLFQSEQGIERLQGYN